MNPASTAPWLIFAAIPETSGSELATLSRIAFDSSGGSLSRTLARVGADRHLGVPYRDRGARLGEVGDVVDVGSRRNPDHELVGDEGLGLLEQSIVGELVGQARVRRRVDVGDDALADLGGEIVGAREGELDVGSIELVSVLLERGRQRRGGEDDELGLAARRGRAAVVGAAACECERHDGDEDEGRGEDAMPMHRLSIAAIRRDRREPG